MSTTRHLTCALLAIVAGCGGDRPAVAPPPAADPAGEAGSPGAGGEAWDLCLADPGGTDAVDRELRALQRGARRLAGRSDPWVRAGRQWVRKARLASDPGFYLNAGGCADAVLEVEPGSVPALELRILVAMNDHRFDDARTLAEAVLKEDPENAVALGLLSDALLELGRYDQAAATVKRLIETRPGMAASVRASFLRWLRGDATGAKRFIREALVNRDARDPEAAAWTFVEAGTIYWHEADYDGADAVYAESLRWLEDYPAALVGRARVALARGEAGRAVELLETAYHKRPLAETAWLLGDACELGGDSAGARRAFDEVVRQGRRGDRLTLATFYATKDRDIGEALRLLAQEGASRRSIYLEDAHAWALYRAGRIEEARAASELALRLGTRDARLLYHAGAIRYAAGEGAAGCKLVRAALDLNPGFDLTGAREARALLEGRCPPARVLAATRPTGPATADHRRRGEADR